jgi:hypothetical protein
MALILCLIAFVSCFLLGRRSIVNGLSMMLGIGYLYGITRANLPDTFSHFIFDGGVLGLYVAQLSRPISSSQQFRIKGLKPWVEFLIAWPVLLFFIPMQDALIQLVGLRGNIFLVPLLLIGARLETEERYSLALWVAALNLMAFGFASVEFFLGLERFFPRNEVTKIIYLSKDVMNHSAYRIPSSFANPSAYGGTMVLGLPLLIGALVQSYKVGWHKKLLLSALAASLLGVFMSASRTHFVVAFILIVVSTFSLRTKVTYAFGWILMLCALSLVVSNNERFQRFTMLQNADVVTERVRYSVDIGFSELVAEYPFGNGLGGGGTSIPYFLQDRIKDPVLIENEYARIMLEEGVLGLVLWVAFIIWVLTRRTVGFDPWYIGRRLAWITCGAYFVVALTGTGTLTSIPGTCLLLLNCAWVAVPNTYDQKKPDAPERIERADGLVVQHG